MSGANHIEVRSEVRSDSGTRTLETAKTFRNSESAVQLSLPLPSTACQKHVVGKLNSSCSRTRSEVICSSLNLFVQA